MKKIKELIDRALRRKPLHPMVANRITEKALDRYYRRFQVETDPELLAKALIERIKTSILIK